MAIDEEQLKKMAKGWNGCREEELATMILAERAKVTALELQLRQAQEVIHEAIGEAIDSAQHDPDCPEDDTCECERVKKINAAMVGFSVKLESHGGCPDCGQGVTGKDALCDKHYSEYLGQNRARGNGPGD